MTAAGTSTPLRRGYLYDREHPAMEAIDHRELWRVSASVARALAVPEATDGQPADCFAAPSCLGARLIASDGTTWGVLCHFDHRLRTAPPSESVLLQFLGARAGRWLDRTDGGDVSSPPA